MDRTCGLPVARVFCRGRVVLTVGDDAAAREESSGRAFGGSKEEAFCWNGGRFAEGKLLFRVFTPPKSAWRMRCSKEAGPGAKEAAEALAALDESRSAVLRP